jgi:three-Cys-motif partner protein
MNTESRAGLDAIGYWSELKLDIIRKYAAAFSTIFSAESQRKFYHVYIDAFAGAGVHVSRTTGGLVPGSPLNALQVDPPFREYHLIDLDRNKAKALRELTGDRPDVHIYEGDCNSILLETVFPLVRYESYRRGLCLLDPYGLHLDWRVIKTAGLAGTLDVFLNFPVADMNRNVLWRNPEGVSDAQAKRLNAFWGDGSWRQAAYNSQENLFGFEQKARGSNGVMARAFRERLRQVAGFKHVPEPMPMRNGQGAIVYYLFFASQKPVADHIVRDIFSTYEHRGMI